MVTVEVIFIDINAKVFQKHYVLPLGSSVKNILDLTEIKIEPNYGIGIFAKLVTLDTILKDGDRVEIYRALPEDPKEKRRQKAKKQRDKL